MAVEWKWVASKPCKIVKYNEERGRIVVLSDEEADELLPYPHRCVEFRDCGEQIGI